MSFVSQHRDARFLLITGTELPAGISQTQSTLRSPSKNAEVFNLFISPHIEEKLTILSYGNFLVVVRTNLHGNFNRNLLGEELGPLSSKELESLERQLDASLKQIRSTRVPWHLFFFSYHPIMNYK